eukprot:1668064-Prymnesium_polylepis.1
MAIGSVARTPTHTPAHTRTHAHTRAHPAHREIRVSKSPGPVNGCRRGPVNLTRRDPGQIAVALRAAIATG